jgi:hypothetical protein
MGQNQEHRMRALAAVLVAGTAMLGAQDHTSHVDRRHEHATHLPSDATEHHFALTKTGGSIRLEVKDESQTAVRDRIRAHLQVIARSFAAGDFALPMRIHEQVPPGAETMKARQAKLRYSYAPSAKGGVVTISTSDSEALRAVHQFLRFQIEDHATGDPTEPR